MYNFFLDWFFFEKQKFAVSLSKSFYEDNVLASCGAAKTKKQTSIKRRASIYMCNT